MSEVRFQLSLACSRCNQVRTRSDQKRSKQVTLPHTSPQERKEPGDLRSISGTATVSFFNLRASISTADLHHTSNLLRWCRDAGLQFNYPINDYGMFLCSYILSHYAAICRSASSTLPSTRTTTRMDEPRKKAAMTAPVAHKTLAITTAEKHGRGLQRAPSCSTRAPRHL